MVNDGVKQILIALCVLSLWVIAAIGWVLNVITVFHADFQNVDDELIVRLIGIVIAPIGCVVGWF